MKRYLIRNSLTGEFFLPVFREGSFEIAWTPSASSALEFQRDPEFRSVDKPLRAELFRKVALLEEAGFNVDVVSAA